MPPSFRIEAKINKNSKEKLSGEGGHQEPKLQGLEYSIPREDFHEWDCSRCLRKQCIEYIGLHCGP